jgi:putative FmdB family regulatory protein
VPTYEYACRKCGEHLEVVQSFKDDALTVCPNCKGKLRKVFGNIGITFKGSGFYRTDSRTSSSKVPRKTDAAAGADGGKSTQTTSAGSSTSSDSSSSSSSSSGSDSKSSSAAS